MNTNTACCFTLQKPGKALASYVGQFGQRADFTLPLQQETNRLLIVDMKADSKLGVCTWPVQTDPLAGLSS